MSEDDPSPPRRTGAPEPSSRLQGLGRALRHRNYRLYFFGQSISLVGTWLTRVATSWLVYRLTGSAVLLGVVGFAGQIPTFFLAPLAGVWVDRMDRRRLLLATQVLAMLQSASLAVLALAGIITVWEIVALAVVQGLVNAFDMPGRQAFVVQMVEHRDDLPNAIALNSSMVNAARLVGPSIAGLLIAAVGEGGVFAIDAVSYLAVIASLLMMHLAASPRRARKLPVLQELLEGFHYAARFSPIRTVLLLLALCSLTGMPYMVLMPMVAGRVLSGGATTLGWLMAATGLGALAGGLHLASRKSVLGLGRVIALASALFGVGLVAFSMSRTTWLSLLILPFVGGGMMVQMAASNTVVQTLVDEDKRGRVMAFYAMSFVGTLPFGSLAGGFLADRIGAPATIRLGGLACVVGAAAFALYLPRLRIAARPVYVKKGILPEIAEGLHRASEAQVPPEK